LAMSGIVEHCHDEITGIKWLNAVSGYLGLAGARAVSLNAEQVLAHRTRRR
jgi:hypothetical protein